MRPEWLVRKSQKLAEKSRIEQKRGDIPRQRNHIIDQSGSGQRKETRKPQIEQSSNKNIEQSRENISRQGYDPQEPIIPIYPNQVAKSLPKLPERVIQDDRQIDLELDLEINRDFEENYHIKKE